MAIAYCNVLASQEFNRADNVKTLADLEHKYMVDLVDKLAQTLKIYANYQSINVDMDYCRKMFWGGTFSTLDNYEKEFTLDERKEISAIVNAELNNKPYPYQLSDGTIQTTTAKGEVINSNSCD